MITVRRDDLVPTDNWTALPTIRSRIGRSWAILRASVLIRDGLPSIDFRVRIMKWLGGKLVLILQPTGFPENPGVQEALEAADLVLVPYPERLLHIAQPLANFPDKVRIVSPVLDLNRVVRAPPSDRLIVYCSVARPESTFGDVLERAKRTLSIELARDVEFVGGVGQFVTEEERRRGLSLAHVMITQGTTAAFEALILQIPLVVVPLPDSPEQIALAELLADRGMADWIPVGAFSAPALAAAIKRAISRIPIGETSLVEQNGLDESVDYIRQVAGLSRLARNRPWLSVIATNYNCAHALDQHLSSIYTLFPESEFEYVVVDNLSDDMSPLILDRWAATHPNFRYLRVKCSKGLGREIAARASCGRVLLVVDTDTVYYPILKAFVMRATSDWPRYAVQAIHAGVLPAFLWRAIGGWAAFNVGEDFEMWMRLHKIGRMRWCPIVMGNNLKESFATDSLDYLSPRYDRVVRFVRLVRTQFDLLRIARYEDVDLARAAREHAVDMDIGPTETTGFGGKTKRNPLHRVSEFGREVVHVLRT